MKPWQRVLSSLLAAPAALVLMAPPSALADPANLHPCEKEWLPSHARGVCDSGQTSGPVPSDRQVGPVGPSGPAGPLGPGGPPDPGGPARPSGPGGPS